MADEHETNAIILAGAVGALLEPNEGVIVHHEGRGYFVVLVWREDSKGYHVVVEEDPAFLQVPNYQKIFVKDDDEDTTPVDIEPTLQ